MKGSSKHAPKHGYKSCDFALTCYASLSETQIISKRKRIEQQKGKAEEGGNGWRRADLEENSTH